MRKVPGWSEIQAIRFKGDTPDTNAELLYLEDRLWASHPDINNPLEPYSGVTALFNADLNRRGSAHTPTREDWLVKSPEVIVHKSTEDTPGV